MTEPVTDTATARVPTEPTATTRSSVRSIAGWVITAAAVALLWCALVFPDRLDRLTVSAFVRIPIEALVLVAVALLLPRRAGRVLVGIAGFVIGVLAVLKMLDMGFYAELNRPFNPVVDWGTFGPAAGVLRDSVGSFWTAVAEIAAIALVVAVLVLVPLAALRVAGLAVRHRRTAGRTIAALGLVWILCAVAGAPIAATGTSRLAYQEIHQVASTMQDRQVFAAAIDEPDPLAHTPTADLLTGLRGKDVIVAFVESYGRVAVQGSAFSPEVDAVLNTGTRDLRAAGFSSRSAFLRSPTFGGISWLAHSTLQSGLWVNSQQRYDQLVASDRYTLSDAFNRAGWRTVGDVPSNERKWPEGRSFYHYDKTYDEHNVGYAGPKFGYAAVPDQYTLATFRRLELAKHDRRPVMAEIDLVSSHTPWAPLPRMVDWNALGNGSIYDGMPEQGQSRAQVWRDAAGVRAAYGQSIQYSLRSLISYVQTFHDDNLVLVVLGDHQPATIVSGSGASHDVPITIIAHDPAVLSRISSWGWQDGMLPHPDAPVWQMSAFRNRFLTAFSG